MRVAAGKPGGPSLGLTLGTGAQIAAIEFVEAGAGEAQFAGRFAGREFISAMTGQEVADEWSGEAMDQLWFFIGANLRQDGGFCALKLAQRTGSAARGAGRVVSPPLGSGEDV